MIHFFTTYQDFLIPLLGGLLLDAMLGDPHRLPHPIRLFGRMIAWSDRMFNREADRKLNQGINHQPNQTITPQYDQTSNRQPNQIITPQSKLSSRLKMKGMLVALGLVLLVFSTLFTLEWVLGGYPVVRNIINTILFFYAICNRSLITEAWKVEQLIVKGDIEAARKQLGRIVGRDTSRLSAKQIRTATLETLAENLSDGVIAPLFYYALGGIPLMMAYKMVNTLDSMIGYKNEKYRDFGWFAARILDDTANFIPARITALFMVILPPSAQGFLFIARYARQHTSPNAGFPESALAGILDCRFGGPNIYHGKLVEKPYIGQNDRDLTHSDVRRACLVNLRVTVMMTLTIIALIFGIFYFF